jgi:hypothetical protein
MSANLDLIKGIYARWEQGDFGSAEWADPEIELIVRDGTAPGIWRGHSEMAAAWREVLNAWDDFRTIAEEYRELDAKRILVLTRNTGRGKASGMELGEISGGPHGANLLELRDRKVIRLTAWWDRDRALAELGLSGS